MYIEFMEVLKLNKTARRTMKEWRILNVMSICELSERTGISQVSLCILENNPTSISKTKREVLQKIANVFGIGVENFLEYVPNKLEEVDTYEWI